MATEIMLGVSEPGADAVRLEELALQLRDELLQHDVESVEQLVVGEAPDGTRAPGLALAAGALVASLDPTKVVGVVRAVIDWVKRGGSDRTVKVQIGDSVIELSGASPETEKQLVDSWLKHHALT